MVAPKINMHGKIYDLLDEIDLPQKEAKAKLAEVHKSGKRAFLNPRKRKNMETTYYIYTAEPTPRKPRETKKEPEVKETEQPKKNGNKKNGKKNGNKKVAPKKKGNNKK